MENSSLQPGSLGGGAILASWLYVPLSMAGDLAKLQRELTYKSPFADKDDLPLQMWTMRLPGYIGVPRGFGRRRWPGIPLEDRRTDGGLIQGVTRLPDPNHPRVREPVKQAQFMEDLFVAMNEREEFLATAPTGSGKTFCSLHAAARRGRTTLILVHLERLMDQWIVDSIIPGLGVPAERIGIVQQDKCEFRDKDFVVGLLHSVVRRRYVREFYEAFGTVIFDEVHKVGTGFFSPAAGMFPARVKVGLSATMNRKDGGDRVFFWHLGPIAVRSEAEAMPCKVIVRRFNSNFPLFGKTPMARASCLSKIPSRNKAIAGVVKQFYDQGRNALIVSSSIEHLDVIMKLTHEMGVPYRVMGRFTGEVHKGTVVVTDDFGQKRKKKLRVKRQPEQLRRVKEEAQLVFATYGMMTEGIDIPRLDAGIDATPQGKATQLIGRIRRPLPGKKEPIWITILDSACSISQRLYQARLHDYLSTNCTVIDHGQGVSNAKAA